MDPNQTRQPKQIRRSRYKPGVGARIREAKQRGGMTADDIATVEAAQKKRERKAEKRKAAR